MTILAFKTALTEELASLYAKNCSATCDSYCVMENGRYQDSEFEGSGADNEHLQALCKALSLQFVSTKVVSVLRLSKTASNFLALQINAADGYLGEIAESYYANTSESVRLQSVCKDIVQMKKLSSLSFNARNYDEADAAVDLLADKEIKSHYEALIFTIRNWSVVTEEDTASLAHELKSASLLK
jgi:hypothetical protein